MTIKELRISKGLTQTECAKYLGMSMRNYQNYENDPTKENTVRYNAIYQKLESYGGTTVLKTKTSKSEFRTNVVTGEELKALYQSVEKLEKRDCYKQLMKYLKGEYPCKIGILYGLRRTGKTTMLFQAIGDLPLNKTVYIKAKTTDVMTDLTKDLDALFRLGFRYVFVDEITLMEDFINTSALLADIYSAMGMKIVVSGTDSLGFAMARRDELYDRNVMIHTSFISFKEYVRLLNLQSVDIYIEYGGTLKMENMSFDDPDATFDDVSFRDDESTRKYIDTAISRNIQHTLKNDTYGEYFNQLRELYDAGELTNVINRIVENMNHRFVLRVIEDRFKSSDFGSARNLLAHDIPDPVGYVLTEVDYEQIIGRLKALIDIKEKSETKIKVTQEHIEKVKKYLIMLDLIENCPNYFESGSPEDHYIFVQPGMRYAIAKALTYSLMQDPYFSSISIKDKDYVIKKILEDVKGRMLEDIVLLEVSKAAGRDKKVFKYKFDEGGEFDMVICDNSSMTSSIYEIKHSDKIVAGQARHLEDEEKCKTIAWRYGPITSKVVLYRGKTEMVGDIQYKNVEEFLMEL